MVERAQELIRAWRKEPFSEMNDYRQACVEVLRGNEKEEQDEDEEEAILRRMKALGQSGLLRTREQFEHPKRFLHGVYIASQDDRGALYGAILSHFHLYGGALVALDRDPAQHTSDVDGVDSGRATGAFALVELGHGSFARHLETTAVHDAGTGEYVLDTPHRAATKFWVGHLPRHATHAIVFARLLEPEREGQFRDEGIHAFHVSLREHRGGSVQTGSCGPKRGWHGMSHGFLIFRSVRLPSHALLGPRNAVLTDLLQYLVVGRVAHAMAASVFMAKALKAATRLAEQREAVPGLRLMDLAHHHVTLVPLLVRSIGLDLARNELIDQLPRFFSKKPPPHSPHSSRSSEDEKARVEESASSEEDSASLAAQTGGLKAYMCETASAAVAQVRRLCGGFGVSLHSGLDRWQADADMLLTVGGDTTRLHLRLARHLLDSLQPKYGTPGGVRWLVGDLSTWVLDQNPVARTFHSEENLLDHYWQLRALRFRVRWLLGECAQQVRTGSEEESSTLFAWADEDDWGERRAKSESSASRFALWNEAMPCLMALSRASCELYIQEQFVRRVEKERDPEAHRIVALCTSLHALDAIRRDLAFFRNARYFSSSSGRLTEAVHRRLVLRLRPHAAWLAESADLIPELLQSSLLDPRGHIKSVFSIVKSSRSKL